jgi:primosomal protein N''
LRDRAESLLAAVTGGQPSGLQPFASVVQSQLVSLQQATAALQGPQTELALLQSTLSQNALQAQAFDREFSRASGQAAVQLQRMTTAAEQAALHVARVRAWEGGLVGVGAGGRHAWGPQTSTLRMHTGLS